MIPKPTDQLLFLLLLAARLTTAATPACYAPDGSLSPGDGYLPCINTVNVESMCCVLNFTALAEVHESSSQADICLSSGLCQTVAGEFLRNFCTDKTWKSPNCLNICAGGSDGGVSNTNSFMTRCGDGSWCCGEGNLTSCCDLSLGFPLASTIPPFAASTVAAAAAATTAVKTTTMVGSGAAATGNASASQSGAGKSTNSSSNSSNSGLAIGLGVALGIVALAAAAAVFMLFRRLREVRGAGGYTGVVRSNSGGVGSYGWKSELEQPHMVHEVGAVGEPVEMDGRDLALARASRQQRQREGGRMVRRL